MAQDQKELHTGGTATAERPETENVNAELYGHLYKSLKMGADSILALLPKVHDEGLRTVMTVQLGGYDKLAARATEGLAKYGGSPKEENIVTKLSAKMGMAMNTMADTTSSHIAEMMIEGSTMGMTDAGKQASEYENKHAAGEAIRFAREIVSFEEGNIENLKKYL